MLGFAIIWGGDGKLTRHPSCIRRSCSRRRSFHRQRNLQVTTVRCVCVIIRMHSVGTTQKKIPTDDFAIFVAVILALSFWVLASAQLAAILCEAMMSRFQKVVYE